MKTTKSTCAAVILAVASLFLAACTSAQVIATARVAIASETADAAAANWAPGVTYGNAALHALVCIANIVAANQTVALKTAAISACGIISVPTNPNNATEATVVSVISATLNGVLIAYGVVPPTPVPATLTAALSPKVISMSNRIQVKLKDGEPGWLERRQLLKEVELTKAAIK